MAWQRIILLGELNDFVLGDEIESGRAMVPISASSKHKLACISMKSGLFETLQHMVVGGLRAELRGEPLGV